MSGSKGATCRSTQVLLQTTRITKNYVTFSILSEFQYFCYFNFHSPTAIRDFLRGRYRVSTIDFWWSGSMVVAGQTTCADHYITDAIGDSPTSVCTVCCIT